jgi:hypothetical protein
MDRQRRAQIILTAVLVWGLALLAGLWLVNQFRRPP